jgi:hypothetical protein
MKYQVTIPFTGQNVANEIIPAFEGGSNYWIESVERIQGPPKLPEGANWYENPAFWESDFIVAITEDDEKEPKLLTPASIQHGLQTMADKFPTHFADMISENGDADTADVFLQCCLFGELVYG